MMAGTVIHPLSPKPASVRSHRRVCWLLNPLQMWLLGGQRVCYHPDGVGVSGTLGSPAEALEIEVPGCSFSS